MHYAIRIRWFNRYLDPAPQPPDTLQLTCPILEYAPHCFDVTGRTH